MCQIRWGQMWRGQVIQVSDARPAPQKAGLAPPRKIDKIDRGQQGKTDRFLFITPSNYAYMQKEERVENLFI